MWISKAEMERRMDALWNGRTFHKEHYYTNCAGYAFGTGGWYEPTGKNEDLWYDYHRKNTRSKWRKLERTLVKRILKDFPGWELTNQYSLECGHEYVAFRIRRIPFYCDYHFMKFDGVKWTEKHGREPVSQEWFKLEDVFEPEAWDEYDGKLFVFQKKAV